MRKDMRHSASEPLVKKHALRELPRVTHRRGISRCTYLTLRQMSSVLSKV